ncbi:hypothetical protein M409DRAFT_19768 [Zasmidium cellare ATCC 36951]|uniref:Uncharacterized protein n=1 Tax=Zasmidium cellare ATCC 36951 TaxID=1080233 RepID=A0A6A6CWG6_ZASCE|nr:uncharacterized protein M409DRAFT_19768 [Zasmidium cellare ATCC 36951]KAF2170162.1 hypothetical protein M409DRAFT_19768 [Zasmidium cellare ATCC 36951]
MANDDDHDRAIDIHSFLEQSSALTPSIPATRANVTCCCGNEACAYLKHNQSALDGLERDVCTAAQLGKALLMRHEAYIADSEKERKAMTAHIEMLETEKKELEQKNANAIEENRNLLDQLENLNGAVAESDTQVTNLQATLRSTQQELQKLSYLAARTEKLEQQLVEFEREQVSWHSTLEEKETAKKSALRRWQQAERTLADLQDEMERIEKEAKEEKERHVEVVGRMERRHAVERELDSAAGRLKGAAALKNGTTEGSGPNVVSHFVKDILQDNANLQMGIVELRDMLHTSNEEVETLRKQLSLHQPVVTEADIEQPTPTPAARPHLKEEMRRATASELHVHHHYHAPSSAPKTALRKPKKKRYGALTPGHFTPPSGASTPRHSFSPGTPSAASAILSSTAASLPENVSKRLSIQSNQTYNSMREFSGPSSPMSTHRSSSLFDRVFSDAGQDSSRPSTPETEEPSSPVWATSLTKRSSKASYHSQQPSTSSHKNRPSLDSILDMSTENLRQFEQQQTAEAVIPEEDEREWENTSSSPNDEESSATSPLSEELEQAFQKRPGLLRRATSHESILSFSGMDIHTLKSRPSQLLTPYGRSFTPQASLTSATAVASRPAAISRPSHSGASILSGMAPSPRHPSEPRQSGTKPGLGSKVGGWVFGRWGASPTPSVTGDPDTTPTAPKMNRTTSVASGSTAASSEASQDTPRKPPKQRPPGINQSGPILGFAPETKLNHPPIVKTIDHDALKKALGN